ncbi:hypothetical protein ACNQ2B_00995 [Mycoplasma sp. Z707]|uniref:hypothetical protein n=1 Tax=Mycoplasma sp. Z707 TaxID=3401691 RepID=UPI003AAAD6D4
MENIQYKLRKPNDLEIYQTVYAVSKTRNLSIALYTFFFTLYILLLVLGEVALKNNSYAYTGLYIFQCIIDTILLLILYKQPFCNKKTTFLSDTDTFTMDAVIYLYLTVDSLIVEKYINSFMRKQFGGSKYWISIKYYILQHATS